VVGRAEALGRRLHLPLASDADPAYDVLLAVDPARLEVRFPQRGGPGPIFVDFVGGSLGYSRRINRFGQLFQAVGMRGSPPSIIDATAGLGHDAFLLASNGCMVRAIERSPILAELIQDGLDRANAVPAVRDALADRL
jgi:16S rRNA (guanine1516-N2)-methyltransferase